MAVHQTLELGNPLLRQAAQEVADVRDPQTQALIRDLWDTLDDFRQRHGWGSALSAPVIGVGQRVVVVALAGRRLTLINPRFEGWSRDQVVAYESCMTFPDLYGQVSRQAQVVVSALDEDGIEQRYEANGQLARILQHEIDHLDGLVWLDRDPDLASFCTGNEYRRQMQQPRLPDGD
jgi:peptide deformylase